MKSIQTWFDIIQLPIFTVAVTSLLTLFTTLVTLWLGNRKAERVQQKQFDHEERIERKRKELEELKEMQRAMYSYYDSLSQLEGYYLIVGDYIVKSDFSSDAIKKLGECTLSLDGSSGKTWRILQNIYGFGDSKTYEALIKKSIVNGF